MDAETYTEDTMGRVELPPPAMEPTASIPSTFRGSRALGHLLPGSGLQSCETICFSALGRLVCGACLGSPSRQHTGADLRVGRSLTQRPAAEPASVAQSPGGSHPVYSVLPFPVILPLSPASALWGHFPNKLLSLVSFS